MLSTFKVEAASSDLMTADLGHAGSGGTPAVKEKLIVRFLSKIVPAVILRFLVLFIAVSLISATSPVFCMDNPEDYVIFMSGFEAYQHKDYSGALQNFNALIKKYPDTPLLDVVLFWISRTHYKTGNQMESARFMSRLIKKYPDSPMRGFAEDEMLELVSRYEHGEQLSTKFAKAGIPKGSRTSAANAALETSKMKSSTPEDSNGLISRALAAESRRPEPAQTGTEMRSAAFKLTEKPTASAEQTVVAAASISATPARGNTGSRSEPPVPTAEIERTASAARQAQSAALIKEIKTGESYIDIVTAGSPEGYKTFRLLHPDRLVIDIPGAKSAIAAKSISIKRMGISKARIGINHGVVRIVLDATKKSPFPAYDVKPFANGLRITAAPSAAMITDRADRVPVMTPAGSRRDRGSVPPVQTSAVKQKLPVAAPAQSVVRIREITTGESFIDIVTGGSIKKYKSFNLNHPGRLVIDIPGAKSAVDAKSISIKRFGISKVRIGINRTTVRIVLDAAQSLFPEYEIRPTENGLRIDIK